MDIKVENFRKGNWGYKKAFCNVLLVDEQGDQIALHGFSVIDTGTGKGPFAVAPSKKRVDKEGKAVKDIKTGKDKYDPLFVTSELLTQRIKDAIMNAYNGDEVEPANQDTSMDFPPKDPERAEVTRLVDNAGDQDGEPDF
jgi:hypothetical protein